MEPRMFSTVPAEIRYKIYDFILSEEAEIDCCHCDVLQGCEGPLSFPRKGPKHAVLHAFGKKQNERLPLLLLSKQISLEVSGLPPTAITITTCTVMCLRKWSATSELAERELVHKIRITEERDNDGMSVSQMARLFRQFKDELAPSPLRSFLGGGWEKMTVRAVRRFRIEVTDWLSMDTGKRLELSFEVENAMKDSDMPDDPI